MKIFFTFVIRIFTSELLFKESILNSIIRNTETITGSQLMGSKFKTESYVEDRFLKSILKKYDDTVRYNTMQVT